MRILLVTNDYPPKPGGIQQYLAGLVDALDAEIRILAPADDGDASGDVHRGHRRFMWPTRRTRAWVRSHVDDFSPDVIFFGAPHPLAFMGPRLREDTGVPFGVLCHGAEVTLPAAFPITRQLVRWPLRRADVVFAVSAFTSAKVERLTKRSVDFVGAGVDSSFAPGPTRPGDEPVVVGCVSRFVPRKGQARVLRSCAALRDEGRDVEVHLVGTGRDERRLRRLADRLEVPTTFEVGVPFRDLPGTYHRMDVFAMPCRSRWFGLEAEGLGVVFLEAAASRLPVVAGDSGGSPETVDPGRTGYVVDRDAALTDALRLLVDDADRRRSMGEAGVEWVSERFSWGAVADRYRAGFERVAGNAR
jgi:phosphatidylinositol alpha-1,6-mannosyltransferase